MHRRAVLRLEELGGRVMPSVALPPVLGGPALLNAAPSQPTLFGSAHGHFQVDPSKPDAGEHLKLQGEGDLAGMGHVTLSGSLHGVGMIASGTASGKLTFTASNGSVTLELTGPPQPGFAALPDRFGFRVVKGTGAFEGLHGGGAVYFHFAQDGSNYFTLAVRPMASGIRGSVRVGPIFPVDRPGVTNSRPLPGAEISVRLAAGGDEIAHAKAGDDGSFSLSLDPGTYLVTIKPPKSSGGWPRSDTETVVVRPGQFVWLPIVLDSGIR